MIDLPFLSKLSSCLERLAFGYEPKAAERPILRTISSLSSVISHPTATAKEIRTAERLLLRALERTRSLPRYPAKIVHPLRAARMVGPAGVQMCPARSRGAAGVLSGKTTAHSVDRSACVSHWQTARGAVTSRGTQGGGRVPWCRHAPAYRPFIH